MSAPIFEGGKLRAQIEDARGGADAALANYHKAVLTALSDVENALVSLANSRRRVVTLGAAVELADGELVKGFLCESYAVEHAREITAVTNQWVNSYKRLFGYRVAERIYDKAFPQSTDSLVAVIDAPSSAEAEQAVEQLKDKLAPQTNVFRMVRRPPEET